MNRTVAIVRWGDMAFAITHAMLQSYFSGESINNYPVACCYTLAARLIKPHALREGVEDPKFDFKYYGYDIRQPELN